MRMWMVPPSHMCNKHLVGEHVELHMFIGSLNKRIKMDGYIKNNCLEPLSLEKRHTHIVEEMKKRGMKHNSPLPKGDISYLPSEYINYAINQQDSEKELFCRCNLCRERSI